MIVQLEIRIHHTCNKLLRLLHVPFYRGQSLLQSTPLLLGVCSCGALGFQGRLGDLELLLRTHGACPLPHDFCARRIQPRRHLLGRPLEIGLQARPGMFAPQEMGLVARNSLQPPGKAKEFTRHHPVGDPNPLLGPLHLRLCQGELA